jgi:SAM-dependent methyltransferase
MDTKEVFEDIFFNRKWGKTQESVSGTGSSIQTTTKLRKDLLSLCKELSIHTFLDAPCGDCNWTRMIPWEANGISYVGWDIVPEVIQRASKAMPNHLFEVRDITCSNLPSYDAIMVRDCLFHLSYDLIHQALINIKKSNIKYLLSTTFINHTINKDIVTGGWRTINLETAPFNLPSPIKYLNDFYPDPQFYDKRLAVWKISDL